MGSHVTLKSILETRPQVAPADLRLANYVVENDLELPIFLPLPPESWNFRCMPQHSVRAVLDMIFRLGAHHVSSLTADLSPHSIPEDTGGCTHTD